MDEDEIQMVRESVRSLVDGAPVGGSIADELEELGWAELLEESPELERLLFEEHGRAGVATTVVDDAINAALGVEEAAVVVSGSSPDSLLRPATARRVDERVVVDGVARLGARERLVVAVGDDGADAVYLVDASLLSTTPIAGLDVDGGWHRAAGEFAASEATPLEIESWERAVAVGRRALAAELVGAGDTALRIAIDHVSSRTQFGQPIATYQAVRFRLAESYAFLEGARTAVSLAFASDDPLAAATAKALAGRAADNVIRQAFQVCGAMGLSWEFPLHPIARRIAALDSALGGVASLRRLLGRAVVTASSPLDNPVLAS